MPHLSKKLSKLPQLFLLLSLSLSIVISIYNYIDIRRMYISIEFVYIFVVTHTYIWINFKFCIIIKIDEMRFNLSKSTRLRNASSRRAEMGFLFINSFSHYEAFIDYFNSVAICHFLYQESQALISRRKLTEICQHVYVYTYLLK